MAGTTTTRAGRDPATAPGGAHRTSPWSSTRDRAAHERITLVVTNTGDRPVQIGSHVHLPDANAALDLDRVAAHGFRLDVPSGTSRRFEPGASAVVAAVTLRGARRVPGIQRDKTDGGVLGAVDEPTAAAGRRPQSLAQGRGTEGGRDLACAVRRAVRPDDGRPGAPRRHRPVDRGRARTARSAARRRCSAAAKSIRESMAQGIDDARRPARWTPSSPTRSSWTGGAWSGPTSASATAGSSHSAAPATRTWPTACTRTCTSARPRTSSPARARSSPRAASTSHVHLLSPSQVHEALATGLTTVVGGGTGPSEGSKATTVTPGAWHLAHDPPCARRAARERAAARQGQHRLRRGARRAGARGRGGLQGA